MWTGLKKRFLRRDSAVDVELLAVEDEVEEDDEDRTAEGELDTAEVEIAARVLIMVVEVVAAARLVVWVVVAARGGVAGTISASSVSAEGLAAAAEDGDVACVLVEAAGGVVTAFGKT